MVFFAFCRWFFRCFFYFVFSYLQSWEVSIFSVRSAEIMEFRVQREKMFPPLVGNCTLPTSTLLLISAVCAVLSLVKVTQGRFSEETRGETANRCSLITVEERGSGPETRSLHLVRAFSQCMRVCFTFILSWVSPEPRHTCCCSQVSCQQWHLLSVAIEHLNVNIFALKWMEKYLSLSGNHSSNKRLARQGP